MNISWAADLHLDMADERQRTAFYDQVRESQCDVLLLAGDVANGLRLVDSLHEIHGAVACPVLFVLGNHDYWGRFIGDTQQRVAECAAGLPRLTYLSVTDPVAVGKDTCVVGHDGWADGRFGDFARSPVVLVDYVKVRDFVPLNKWERLTRMKQLGDAAADHLRRVLAMASAQYARIIVVTHIPPFAEVCHYRGVPCDPHHLPHYSCRAAAEAIHDAAVQWPHRQFLVLCGHTHAASEVQIAPNLTVRVAPAEYGRPRLAGHVQP